MRWVVRSAVLAGLLSAATARAQEQDPAGADAVLAELSDQLVRARFSQTLPAARALLEREDLTARQRVRALEALAVTQIVLGDAEADDTLATLFARDPRHRLGNPDLGPSVQAAFARARERAGEPVQVELGEVRVEPDPGGGSPFVVVTLFEGADAVDEVVLSFRDGRTGFTPLGLRRAAPTEARARLPVVGGGELAYYVEARAPSGATLARLGSPDEPLVAELPERSSEAEPLFSTAQPDTAPAEERDHPGLLGQWWLWTAVAAVLGGAIAGYVLLGPPAHGPAPGSLGQGALE